MMKSKTFKRMASALLSLTMLASAVPFNTSVVTSITSYATGGGDGTGGGNTGGGDYSFYGYDGQSLGFRFYIVDATGKIVTKAWDIKPDGFYERPHTDYSIQSQTRYGDAIIAGSKKVSELPAGLNSMLIPCNKSSTESNGAAFKSWMLQMNWVNPEYDNREMLIKQLWGENIWRQFANNQSYLVMEPVTTVPLFTDYTSGSYQNKAFYGTWYCVLRKLGEYGTRDGGWIGARMGEYGLGYRIEGNYFNLNTVATNQYGSTDKGTIAPGYYNVNIDLMTNNAGNTYGYGMEIFWPAQENHMGGDPINTYDIHNTPTEPANPEKPGDNNPNPADSSKTLSNKGDVDIVKVYAKAYKDVNGGYTHVDPVGVFTETKASNHVIITEESDKNGGYKVVAWDTTKNKYDEIDEKKKIKNASDWINSDGIADGKHYISIDITDNTGPKGLGTQHNYDSAFCKNNQISAHVINGYDTGDTRKWTLGDPLPSLTYKNYDYTKSHEDNDNAKNDLILADCNKTIYILYVKEVEWLETDDDLTPPDDQPTPNGPSTPNKPDDGPPTPPGTPTDRTGGPEDKGLTIVKVYGEIDKNDPTIVKDVDVDIDKRVTRNASYNVTIRDEMNAWKLASYVYVDGNIDSNFASVNGTKKLTADYKASEWCDGELEDTRGGYFTKGYLDGFDFYKHVSGKYNNSPWYNVNIYNTTYSAQTFWLLDQCAGKIETTKDKDTGLVRPKNGGVLYLLYLRREGDTAEQGEVIIPESFITKSFEINEVLNGTDINDGSEVLADHKFIWAVPPYLIDDAHANSSPRGTSGTKVENPNYTIVAGLFTDLKSTLSSNVVKAVPDWSHDTKVAKAKTKDTQAVMVNGRLSFSGSLTDPDKGYYNSSTGEIAAHMLTGTGAGYLITLYRGDGGVSTTDKPVVPEYKYNANNLAQRTWLLTTCSPLLNYSTGDDDLDAVYVRSTGTVERGQYDSPLMGSTNFYAYKDVRELLCSNSAYGISVGNDKSSRLTNGTVDLKPISLTFGFSKKTRFGETLLDNAKIAVLRKFGIGEDGSIMTQYSKVYYLVPCPLNGARDIGTYKNWYKNSKSAQETDTTVSATLKAKVQTYAGSTTYKDSDATKYILAPNSKETITTSAGGKGTRITKDSISFTPYIAMIAQNGLEINGMHEAVYVNGSIDRTITPATYAGIEFKTHSVKDSSKLLSTNIIAISNDDAGKIGLSSNQWSSHARVTQMGKDLAVIPGGAILNLNITSNQLQKVEIQTCYPMLIGAGFEQYAYSNGYDSTSYDAAQAKLLESNVLGADSASTLYLTGDSSNPDERGGGVNYGANSLLAAALTRFGGETVSDVAVVANNYIEEQSANADARSKISTATNNHKEFVNSIIKSLDTVNIEQWVAPTNYHNDSVKFNDNTHEYQFGSLKAPSKPVWDMPNAKNVTSTLAERADAKYYFRSDSDGYAEAVVPSDTKLIANNEGEASNGADLDADKAGETSVVYYTFFTDYLGNLSVSVSSHYVESTQLLNALQSYTNYVVLQRGETYATFKNSNDLPKIGNSTFTRVPKEILLQIKDLDEKTGVVANICNAFERNTGDDKQCYWAKTDGHWYNECFDGITYAVMTTKVDIGFLKPYERTSVIDPQLCPGAQGNPSGHGNADKGDIFTDYTFSQLRTKSYTNLWGPGTDADGAKIGEFKLFGSNDVIDIYAKELEKLFVSDIFLIANATVQDLK